VKSPDYLNRTKPCPPAKKKTESVGEKKKKNPDWTLEKKEKNLGKEEEIGSVPVRGGGEWCPNDEGKGGFGRGRKTFWLCGVKGGGRTSGNV